MMVVHYWGDITSDYLHNFDFIKEIHFSHQIKNNKTTSNQNYGCCLGTEIISIQWNQKSSFHHFYIIHYKVNTVTSEKVCFYTRWLTEYIVYVTSQKKRLFWDHSISTGCVYLLLLYVDSTVSYNAVKADTIILWLGVKFYNMQWYCQSVERIFKMHVNTVESRSIDLAMFVFSYLSCAIFGPE
jgi:hypothetical protein